MESQPSRYRGAAAYQPPPQLSSSLHISAAEFQPPSFASNGLIPTSLGLQQGWGAPSFETLAVTSSSQPGASFMQPLLATTHSAAFDYDTRFTMQHDVHASITTGARGHLQAGDARSHGPGRGDVRSGYFSAGNNTMFPAVDSFTGAVDSVTAGIERLLTTPLDGGDGMYGGEAYRGPMGRSVPLEPHYPQPQHHTHHAHSRRNEHPTPGYRWEHSPYEGYGGYEPRDAGRGRYDSGMRYYDAPPAHHRAPHPTHTTHATQSHAHSHGHYGHMEPMEYPPRMPQPAMAPEDEMAMSALAVAATFSPESVLDFRSQQLDLMRKLLVRRLFLLTRRAEHFKVTQQNIRVALHVFGLPLIVYDLISRPLRGTAVPGSFPSRRQLVDYLSSGSPQLVAPKAPGVAGTMSPVDLIPFGEDQDISLLPTGGTPPVEPAATIEDGTGSERVGTVHTELSSKLSLRSMESRGSPNLESDPGGSPKSAANIDDISMAFCEPNGQPLPEEALGWWPGDVAPGDLLKECLSGEVLDVTKPLSTSPPSSVSDRAGGDADVKVEPAWERSLAVAVVGALTADLIARKRFRTKFCHSWMRSGSCPRGNGCDYAHGPHELRSSSESRDSRYRTRLCRTWMSTCGTYCPHGDKCAFAHGVQQLRVRLPDADEELQQLLSNAQVAVDALTTGGQSAVSGFSNDIDASPFSTSDPSSSSTGTGPSPIPQGLRKFKGSLCRAWLQGATDGALIAGFKLVRDKSEDVSSLRFDAARAGSRRCPHGDACPHAHGLAELRLPAVMEQVRLVEALACEGPYARPGLNGDDAGDGSVPLRDLTLILIASALLTTNLPVSLIPRVAAVAALLGPNAQLPVSGVFPDFEGLPPAFARALSASVVNPMLQVVLPYTAMDRGGGGRKLDGMDLPPGHRVGLAKIISAVGNESADTAILAGAVSMGGVTFALPLHMLAETDPEREKQLMSSTATGRYGVLLRRRLEIQAALQDLARAKNHRVPGRTLVPTSIPMAPTGRIWTAVPPTAHGLPHGGGHSYGHEGHYHHGRHPSGQRVAW